MLLYRASKLNFVGFVFAVTPFIWAAPAIADDLNLPSIHSQIEVTATYAPNGSLLVGWMDADDPLGNLKNAQCAFSVSGDHGHSWGPPLFHRAIGFGVGVNPAVAVDSAGALYALCLSGASDQSSSIIEFARSMDGGSHWSDWTRIAERTGGVVDKPWIAASEVGKLQVVYSDCLKDAVTGKYTCHAEQLSSTDSGATWSPRFDLSAKMPQISPSPIPFVTGDQGVSVYVDANHQTFFSWGNYEKAIANSSAVRGPDAWFVKVPAGANLKDQEPIALGSNGIQVPVTQVQSDLSGNRVAVVVYDAHGNGKIVLYYSSDGGQSWESPVTLAASATLAAMAFDPVGNLQIEWTEIDWTGQTFQIDVFRSEKRIVTGALTTPVSISGPVLNPDLQKIYIGAYQSLVIAPDGERLGLWLQWGTSGTRVQASRWQP